MRISHENILFLILEFRKWLKISAGASAELQQNTTAAAGAELPQTQLRLQNYHKHNCGCGRRITTNTTVAAGAELQQNTTAAAKFMQGHSQVSPTVFSKGF